jgi:hypothetical protein
VRSPQAPPSPVFEPAKIECLASHVGDVLLLLYGFVVQVNLSGRSDVARLRQGLHEPVSVRRAWIIISSVYCRMRMNVCNGLLLVVFTPATLALKLTLSCPLSLMTRTLGPSARVCETATRSWLGLTKEVSALAWAALSSRQKRRKG